MLVDMCCAMCFAVCVPDVLIQCALMQLCLVLCLQASLDVLAAIRNLGLLCVVCGLCSLKLPETLGRPPQYLMESRTRKTAEITV